MDSTEIPVYGEQDAEALHTTHYEFVTCLSPAAAVQPVRADCVAARLRPGNVHSADAGSKLLLPEIETATEAGQGSLVPADAAFAKPDLYEALEERGDEVARDPDSG